MPVLWPRLLYTCSLRVISSPTVLWLDSRKISLAVLFQALQAHAVRTQADHSVLSALQTHDVRIQSMLFLPKRERRGGEGPVRCVSMLRLFLRVIGIHQNLLPIRVKSKDLC